MRQPRWAAAPSAWGGPLTCCTIFSAPPLAITSRIAAAGLPMWHRFANALAASTHGLLSRSIADSGGSDLQSLLIRGFGRNPRARTAAAPSESLLPLARSIDNPSGIHFFRLSFVSVLLVSVSFPHVFLPSLRHSPRPLPSFQFPWAGVGVPPSRARAEVGGSRQRFSTPPFPAFGLGSGFSRLFGTPSSRRRG
jgi:hypothetical protein